MIENVMRFRKYAAELLGTLCLTLAVALSVVRPTPLATPLIAALTLMIFVYAIGTISGAHLNPAVTVGLWSTKNIALGDAGMYIAAQLIGAFLAQRFALVLTGQRPMVSAENTFVVGLAEAVGAFLLVFAVSAVVAGKVHNAASGLTIGGALLLGILLASSASNGVLNPAVAFGIGSASTMYIIGPLIGGMLGAKAYSWLARP